jgi:hypothetical protein
MNKTLIVNIGWLLAVAAAFIVGMSRGTTEARRESATLDVNSTSSSRNGELSASESAADRSKRRSGLSNADRQKSEIENLFGSVASAAGGLEALVNQAMKDPNPLNRRLAFSRLLESLTPENAESVRAQLVSLGAEGDQWRDFCYAWGALSGKAAIDLAQNSPERDLAETMTGWAAANPSEAMALLQNLPEEMKGQRDELTASVIAGISHKDRAMATDMIAKLAAEGNGRANQLMDIVARQALRTDGPEAAAVWADSLPNGALKGAAMDRIAEAYSRKDPVAAANWAQSQAAEPYASRTIEQIGRRWAEQDPVSAVGWLENLPAGNGQISGLRSAFGDWEDRDPAAASQHLLEMPKSPQRDSAISGFSTGYAWQNPQAAITWAQDISDPELRQATLTRAGEAYLRTAPAAGQAWLQTSGLPAETQQQLLNSANRRR